MPRLKGRVVSVATVCFGLGVILILCLKHAMTTADGELGPWTEPDFDKLEKAFVVPDMNLWGSFGPPYPTGAWWLNLVLEKGDKAAVPATPYQILTSDKGILLSYSSRRRVASRDAQVDVFGIDWLITPTKVKQDFDSAIRNYEIGCCNGSYVAAGDALAGILPTLSRQLDSHSQLGAVVRYETGITVACVKGSPMVTFEIQSGSTSLILSPGSAAGGRIVSVSQASWSSILVHLTDGSRWLVTATETLDFESSDCCVIYTGEGVVRLGYVPSDRDLERLLASCPTTYAYGGHVSFSPDAPSSYNFEWLTKSMDQRCASLALLAQRHHLETLRQPSPANETAFLGAKGRMYWTQTKTYRWRLEEPIFNQITLDDRAPIADTERREEIVTQARRDISALRAHSTKQAKANSYGFVYFQGKELARLARLAIVTADAGDSGASDRAANFLLRRFDHFMQSLRVFSYDATWGGIVATPQNDDPFANFGNGLYSDHHFHYGYYAYAFAVLCERRPLWARRWSRRLRSLVADYANPPDSNRDPRFPVARHKDWYESHSWATGLVVYATGKSQESSSEAMHAYYAVAKLGAALGDENLRDWGILLAATEIRGAQTYWHMHPNEHIYERVFAANRMAGSVSGTAVSAATWFGSNPEYVHGINVLPVLAGATNLLFRPSFVCQQLPVLLRALGREEPPVSQAWRGVVLANIAVARPRHTWTQAKDLDQAEFDDGNSKANLLHYINALFDDATDDDDKALCSSDDYNVDDDDYEDLPCTLDDVQPACSANLACVALGLSGLCCPQSDGYVFGCCPVLKPDGAS